MDNTQINYWKLLINDVNPSSVTDLINFIFPIAIERKEKAIVNLYISSGGGDIDSAIRFYDFIKGSKITINTYGFGQVDSSAIILFLTGQVRVAQEGCRFRLHTPNYNANHQSQHISIIEETSKFLMSLDSRYFQILSKETGISERKIRTLYEKGAIFTPQKAVDFKIATKISDHINYPIS